jgi:hypothetical protein
MSHAGIADMLQGRMVFNHGLSRVLPCKKWREKNAE